MAMIAIGVLAFLGMHGPGGRTAESDIPSDTHLNAVRIGIVDKVEMLYRDILPEQKNLLFHLEPMESRPHGHLLPAGTIWVIDCYDEAHQHLATGFWNNGTSTLLTLCRLQRPYPVQPSHKIRPALRVALLEASARAWVHRLNFATDNALQSVSGRVETHPTFSTIVFDMADTRQVLWLDTHTGELQQIVQTIKRSSLSL